MADLGTLRPGANNATVPGTYTTAWDDTGSNDLSDDSDSTYGEVTTNSSGSYGESFELADMPSDFASMTTVSISLRYAWGSSPSNTTWDTLACRIMASDGTTVLAAGSSGGAYKTIASSITTTTPTTSTASAFTYVNTSATKAQWDGAIVQIGIVRTRSKGGDSDGQRVYEGFVTGTYAPTTTTSAAEVGLATYTPATQTSHSIKVRARVQSGSGVLGAALYEGATNRSGDLTSSALSTSLADYTLAISDASAGNITDYSDLSIRFWGEQGSGSITFEVDTIALLVPEAGNATVSTAGATTPTGTVQHRAEAVRVGALTPAGVDIKAPAVARSATLTPAGAPASRPAILRVAATTPTGTVAERPSQAVAGASTPTGTVARGVTATRTADTTPTGVAIELPRILPASSSTPTGVVASVRSLLMTVVATLTPTGIVGHLARVIRAADTTPTGTAAQAPAQAHASDTTPAGTATEAPRITRTASLTPSGTVDSIRALLVALVGAVTPVGTAIKKAARSLEGEDGGGLSPSGIVAQLARVTRIAATTPTGIVATIRSLTVAVAGALTPAGVAIARARHTLVSDTTGSGTVARLPRILATASQAAAGIVSWLPRITRTADTTPTGTVLELPRMARVGGVTSAGIHVASATKVLVGALTPAATVTHPAPTSATSTAEVGLASYTPATQTDHEFRVRARVQSGANVASLFVALYEGATNRSGWLQTSALSTSLADYTVVIGDTEAGDITDYGDLSVRFYGYDPDGGSIVFEVDYIALMVPTATPGTYTAIATLTPTGTVAFAAAKVFASSSTPTGTVLERVTKALVGALTPTGVVARRPAVAPSSDSTPTGTVLEQARQLLEGTIASAGSLLTDAAESLAVSATISSAGTVARGAVKRLASASTPSGVPTQVARITRSGTVATAGSLVTKTGHLLAGVVASAGRLAFEAYSWVYQPVSRVRDLAWRNAVDSLDLAWRSRQRDLSGIPDEDPAPSPAPVELAFAGAIASAGLVVMRALRKLAGVVTPAGTSTRSASIGRSGALTPTGTHSVGVELSVATAGAVTPTGAQGSLHPEAVDITANGAYVEWDVQPGAQGRVEYSINPDLAGSLLTNKELGYLPYHKQRLGVDNPAGAPVLTAGTTYYFRIAEALTAEGLTLSSAIKSFETTGGTPPPSGAYPTAVTTQAPRTLTSFSAPGYLATVADPTFGTEIARIGAVDGQRHRYSSKPAWNADGSLLLLDYKDGDRAILDGVTFAVLDSDITSSISDFVWSSVDPTKGYDVRDSGASEIDVLTFVTADGSHVNGTIPVTPPGGGTYAEIDWGGGQGAGSLTDEFAFMFRKTNGDQGIGIFDANTGTVTDELVITNSGSLKFDNCGISHLGEWVNIQGLESAGVGNGQLQGTWIIPTNPLTLAGQFQVEAWTDHWDWGMNKGGTEDWFVQRDGGYFTTEFGTNGGGVMATRPNDKARILMVPGFESGIHISGRNHLRPGYVYLCSASPSYDSNMYGQIFSIEIQTPSAVEVFAQHHKVTAASVYAEQPQVVPNPDGTLVIWPVRWESSGAGFYEYVVGVDTGL